MVSPETTKTITELRRDPFSIFKEAKRQESPLYIFSRSRPLGVVLDINEFNKWIELIEDYIDSMELRERMETSKEEDLIPWKEFKKKYL